MNHQRFLTEAEAELEQCDSYYVPNISLLNRWLVKYSIIKLSRKADKALFIYQRFPKFVPWKLVPSDINIYYWKMKGLCDQINLRNSEINRFSYWRASQHSKYAKIYFKSHIVSLEHSHFQTYLIMKSTLFSDIL